MLVVRFPPSSTPCSTSTIRSGVLPAATTFRRNLSPRCQSRRFPPQCDRYFLPFANLRLKIFLPPLLFFLARYPCRRFRTRCDGWYSDPYTAKRFCCGWPPTAVEGWLPAAARRERIGEEALALLLVAAGEREGPRCGRKGPKSDRAGAGRNRDDAPARSGCCEAVVQEVVAPGDGAAAFARAAAARRDGRAVGGRREGSDDDDEDGAEARRRAGAANGRVRGRRGILACVDRGRGAG